MSLYAKIENDIVSNIIVCEDSLSVPANGIYIKITEETNNPEIGSAYNKDKNKFVESKPHASWIFNEDTLRWDSPSEKPAGNYHWSEESLGWVAFTPKPGDNYEWNEESNSWVEKTE